MMTAGQDEDGDFALDTSLFAGQDRVDLERLVIGSSWSSPLEAKDLLQFPSDAWLRPPHRAIVSVLRDLLLNGDAVNDLTVGFAVREKCPEHLDAYRALHDYYASEITSMAGARKQLLRRFREMYDRQSARDALMAALQSLPKKPFAEWHGLLHQQVVALSPSTEANESARTFDQVFLERIDARLKGVEEQRIPTRIADLDRQLKGGFLPGWMVLIVGAPGTGKTVLAFQIALNQAANDVDVVFNQLEMTASEMADRAISMTTGLEIDEITKQDLAKARVSAKYLRSLTLYDQHCSLDEYTRRNDAHIYRRPDTGVIVTDYAGLLQTHSAKANSTSAANEVSSACVSLAKRHKVAHVVLQQPSRQYTLDQKPSLAYIRDSGKFEQDADVILFIHYPRKFDKTMPENYTQLHIMKSRGAPSGGIVHLEWTPGCYTMRQWRGDPPQPNGVQDAARKIRARSDIDTETLEDWTLELP